MKLARPSSPRSLTGYTLPAARLPRRGPLGPGAGERAQAGARQPGRTPSVIQLFALFHDSRRENDGHRPRPRPPRRCTSRPSFAAGCSSSPDAEFALLYRACEWHTEGRTDPDVTVRTCWDADRLDLGRVGIVPSPKYLCTTAAKSPKRHRLGARAISQGIRAGLRDAELARAAAGGRLVTNSEG